MGHGIACDINSSDMCAYIINNNLEPHFYIGAFVFIILLIAFIIYVHKRFNNES